MRQYALQRGITAALLCLLMTVPTSAFTQSDLQIAAGELLARGIMVGDETGAMRLDDPLSRAEMAVLLTRLHGGSDMDPSLYTWASYYTDVPAWARPYVGYCTAMLLVSGYGNARFGPDDPVTWQMACTVILRYCQVGSGWSYDTACERACQVGLLDRPEFPSVSVTRGEMAILIYRALHRMSEPEQAQESGPKPDGITIASDGTILEKTIVRSNWSRIDFSEEASPEIFTGPYSCGWYNAIRQSIVDQEEILAGSGNGPCNPTYLYAHTLVPDQPAETFQAFSDVLAALQGLTSYTLSAEPYTVNQFAYPGYAIVQVSVPEHLEGPLSFVEPYLQSISDEDDRGKVTQLNRLLCRLLDYADGASAGIEEIFSEHASVALGMCGSYTNAMKFLCDTAGIPCVIVQSDNHAWNEVYVDDRWLVVDTTFNDGSVYKEDYLLTEHPARTDASPQATRFAKELLVPGST